MESKEPIKIFVSSRNKKSVAMATFVERCRQKANQLQSVQGYGNQRTHTNIHESKKQKKSVAVAILVARYCQESNYT